MAKTKKEKLSLDEMLEQALVNEEDRPYEVPENWVWTKIGNITEIFLGLTYTPEYVDKGIPFLSVKDISHGSIDFSNTRFISHEEYKNAAYGSKPHKGDILFGRVGTIGCPQIVTDDNEFCIFVSLGFFRSFSEKIIKEYIVHWMNSYLFDMQVKANVKGSTLKNLNTGWLKDFWIPLPPFAEKQRIVGVIESLFEKLDTAKELAQNALDSFENRKAAILHKAFTGELTAKWREENGISLDEWKESSLNTVVTGFKYGVSEKSEYLYTGIPVIRIPNVISNEIDFSDMKYLNHFDISEENQIKENDILIIRSNGSKDLVGKCALVGKLNKPYTFASYLIRIRPSNIDSQYLLYLLNASYVRKQFFDKSKSSAGINNINSKELSSVQIPVPYLEEQKEIVLILDNLLENEQRAKELCDIIEKIDLMKKVILARAFRGELGTNDPKEESAVELLKEVLKEKI